MKTLEEFKKSRRLMTPEEYNENFGVQYCEVDIEDLNERNIKMLVVYETGAMIELGVDERYVDIVFVLQLDRSEYKSRNLSVLEEKLWDEFAKTEQLNICKKDVIDDYKERIMITMEKPDYESIKKANEMFNKLIKLL